VVVEGLGDTAKSTGKALEGGVDPVNDLLSVHSDGTYGRHDDHYEQDQKDGIFADALTFFVASDETEYFPQE
jgi:hypothetical protein